MSSNDFDGSHFRPEGGQGADEQGAADSARYPAPEGWENDGFWRDSAIDSDYETGLQSPVPPAGGTPREEPGYSYFSDRQGWQNSPGAHSWPPAGAGEPPAPGYGGYEHPVPGPAAGYGPPRPAAPGWASGTGSFAGGPAGPGGPGEPGGPGGPRRPGGPGPQGKRKGSWWRHWSWKKALAVCGGIAVVVVLGLVGVYEYLSSSATIPTALASANYQNTTVYYNDGKTPIGTIGTVNRKDLTYAEIPKKLQDAVLAAEDRSFWSEGGISPTGIIRAAYDDVTSSGGSLSGGSTITQEFVKNYYAGVGAQQTVSRKVKEIFIAQKLAKTKSKSWILTNYMNLIYLGENSYGVAAAAQTYFGKPVSQLTIPQDAVIAAIIQQPSNYPLPAYRTSLVTRWHYVLSGMVAMGDLTQAQADAAKFPALRTDKAGAASGGSSLTSSSDAWAPYLMNQVFNELTTAKSDGGPGFSPLQLETGGYKIVTTISHPMEVEMYKSVDSVIATIKATPGATYPSYIRVGAELQNPSNGEILAEYPGPGQTGKYANNSKTCQEWNCAINTALTREQVGSSFKPYVLSAAVAAGMNVKTSTLNASQFLCVPPDTSPLVLSKTMSYFPGSTCPGLPGYFGVENDGGEVIGNAAKGGGATVQTALAQSSNTAFTDLTHRVTTTSVIQMAGAYGVDLENSGLSKSHGATNIALGINSLTVTEQTTMLSAIDDNGVYHQSHIVKYWQSPVGPQTKPAVQSHGVLDPSDPTRNAQLDSQVQYAMEQTTVTGTGQPAAYGLGNRPIIAKTGTSTGPVSGFFIGAIPQYSLVVGMFVAKPGDTAQTLLPLTGGGFGGTWPAKIWNTFAQAEFNRLPVENFQTPVFSGAAWNQVGKIAKPTVTCTVNGQKKKIKGKTCPAPSPSPTPTCQYQGQRNCVTPSGSAAPTPTCSYAGEQFQDGCTTATATAPAGTNPSPAPSCSSFDQFGSCVSSSGGASAAPSPTCTNQADPACGGGGVNPQATATPTKAGLAVAGSGLMLPGSLLWAAASRRRRRRTR